MSVATLAVGILLLWVSVKLLRGSPAAVPPPVPRDDATSTDPTPPSDS
ncbi:MAG: hypothetical protein JO276_04280 [Sphingomonadaceae bacterium]|nr:hypothetical protein [Sphingomonadaceae bacterium]